MAAELVEGMRSGSAVEPRAREMAAELLKRLMIESADNRAIIARAGAIEPLVAMLRGGSAEAQEVAADALRNLAASADDIQVAIARAGAIEPLVALVRSGSAVAQASAAAALANLATGNAANQAAIARAGAIEPLVALVRDGSPQRQGMRRLSRYTRCTTSLAAQIPWRPLPERVISSISLRGRELAARARNRQLAY